MTIEKLEETTRNEIATKLPKMLEKVLTSYELFSDEHVPDPKDVKNFRDHHSACKVAIGQNFRMHKLEAIAISCISKC